MAAVLIGRGVDQIPAGAGRSRAGVCRGIVFDNFARCGELVGDRRPGIHVAGNSNPSGIGHRAVSGAPGRDGTLARIV